LQEIEFFANADDTQLLVETYVVSEADHLARWAEEVPGGFPEIVGLVVFRNPARARMQPDRVALSGAEQLDYKTKKAAYRVSAGASFQANRDRTGALVKIVRAGRSVQHVLELYLGFGVYCAVLYRELERVIAV